MELEIREFIAYLHDIKKTSINTEMSYQRDLKKMWDFLKNRGIMSVTEVKELELEGYISYMDIQFIAIAIGIIVVFIISVLKEKKIDVAQKVISLPWQVRGLMYLAVIFMLPMIGMPPDSVGGFIYAQF